MKPFWRYVVFGALLMLLTLALLLWRVQPLPTRDSVQTDLERALVEPSETTVLADSDAMAPSSGVVGEVDRVAGTVYGRVLTRNGDPAASARVYLFPGDSAAGTGASDSAGGEMRQTETDPAGEFSFDLARTGSFTIAASLGDLGGIARGELPDGATRSWVEIFLGSGGPVAGIVLDETGVGIAGARVYPVAHDRFRLDESESRDLMVTTNGAGEFLLPFLPASQWKFMADAPGFQPESSDHVFTGSDAVRIVLRAGARLAGKVVDVENGAGVPGMKLVALQKGLPLSFRGASDADGSFSFSGLLERAVEVTGSHPTYTLLQVPARLDVGAVLSGDIVLEAAQGGSVQGRIVLPNGSGLAGISVGLLGARQSRRAATDENGGYSFENVSPGDGTLVTTAGAWLEEKVVRVAPGATTQVPDWVVQAGVIRGEVVEEDGAPASGAMVYVSADGPIAGMRSGADGGFVFANPALEGVLELGASLLDQMSATETVDLEANPAPFVKLELSRPRGMISGQVVDSAGRPRRANLLVSSFSGQAIPEEFRKLMAEQGVTLDLETPSRREGSRAWEFNLTTDHEGYFLARVDTPADIHLYLDEARRGGFISRRFPVTEFTLESGESRHDLRLVYPVTDGAIISGHVRDEDGLPVEGVMVGADAVEAGVSGGKTLVDIDGAFTITGLAEGALFKIRAHAQGYMEAVLSDIAAGSENLSITLRRLPRVTGYVTDGRTKKPVSSFDVSVAWGEKVQHESHFKPVQVNHPDGYFELSVPPYGNGLPVALQVRASGFDPYWLELGVLERDAGPYRIELGGGGPPVIGTVKDREGHPVAGARVSPVSPFFDPSDSGTSDAAISDANGIFHLAGTPTGTDAVAARHPEFIETRVSIDPARDREIEIVMSRGAVLEGRIVMDGSPLSGARLRIQESDAVILPTGMDGRYHIGNVPPGTVTLSVRFDTSDGARITHHVPLEIEGGTVNEFELEIRDGQLVVVDSL